MIPSRIAMVHNNDLSPRIRKIHYSLCGKYDFMVWKQSFKKHLIVMVSTEVCADHNNIKKNHAENGTNIQRHDKLVCLTSQSIYRYNDEMASEIKFNVRNFNTRNCQAVNAIFLYSIYLANKNGIFIRLQNECSDLLE